MDYGIVVYWQEAGIKKKYYLESRGDVFFYKKRLSLLHTGTTEKISVESNTTGP